MARKMLDDSYEFVVNWDDGKNVQVEFVPLTSLHEETIELSEEQQRILVYNSRTISSNIVKK